MRGPKTDLHVHVPLTWSPENDHFETYGAAAAVAMLSLAAAKPAKPDVGILGMVDASGHLNPVQDEDVDLIRRCSSQGFKVLVLGGGADSQLEAEALTMATDHGISVFFVSNFLAALSYLFEI